MQNLGLENYTKKDLTAAHIYWRSVFKLHHKQLPEKLPRCRLSIVIPVYAEKTERLQVQLESFAKQSLSKQYFEVIYIVNNSPSDNTSEWKDAYKKNQQVISFLKKYKKVTVHLIDLSSPGVEIEKCNVGKARNRGVAEVSFRYFTQKQDGVLFQTDADTHLENKQYLSQVLSAFRKDKLAFGAAGGVVYELNPDTEDIAERKKYKKCLESIRLYFQWQTLLSEKHKKKLVLPVHPTRFSGMHMISLAIASACIGGVLEKGYAEDTLFGNSLEVFAKKHKGHILPMREKWYVTSSLRESLRTGASFGKILTRIVRDGEAYSYSEKSPYILHFIEDVLRQIQQASSMVVFRNLLSDKTEPFQFSDKNILQLKEVLKGCRGSTARFYAYRKWRMLHVGKKRGPITKLYLRIYPLVRLTKYRISKLKKELHKDPKKLEHFQNVSKHFHRFRLPR